LEAELGVEKVSRTIRYQAHIGLGGSNDLQPSHKRSDDCLAQSSPLVIGFHRNVDKLVEQAVITNDPAHADAILVPDDNTNDRLRQSSPSGDYAWST
jgi:hypothetical protein